MELTKGVCWIVSCSTQIHCEAYPKKDWKWFSSTHNASCSAAIWLTQLQIWGKKQQLCSPRFLCRQETVYSTTKPMKPFYESEVSKLNIKGLQPPPIVFFHTTGFPIQKKILQIGNRNIAWEQVDYGAIQCNENIIIHQQEHLMKIDLNGGFKLT